MRVSEQEAVEASHGGGMFVAGKGGFGVSNGGYSADEVDGAWSSRQEQKSAYWMSQVYDVAFLVKHSNFQRYLLCFIQF